MTSFMHIFSWHLKKSTPVVILLTSWLLIESIRKNDTLLETIDIGMLLGVCPGFKTQPHYVGIDKLTLDHTYPVSMASKDYELTGDKRVYTINDVQPLCQCCNSSKHNKIISCQ